MKKIAIVGGGIAGLTAAYLLREKNEITLFEKTDRVGGNAFTWRTKEGYELDIAVAAFGKAGYKNFYRLLGRLGIPTKWCPTAFMSFQNLETRKGMYMTMLSLKGLILQRFALLKPSTLLAILRVFTSLGRGARMLDAGALDGLSVKEALARMPHVTGDTKLTIMFALCLLSSMSYEDIMKSPATFFFNKLKVHNDLVSLRSIYSFRCVAGGTKTYVNALRSTFADRIVLRAAIRSVLRDADGVTLLMEDGSQQRFDDVIFACPADTALALIANPSEDEHRLLGAWRYRDGTVTVHRDHSSFPPKELIQAYTFLYTDRNGIVDTSVSGATWYLPQVPRESDYISTQHPNFPIRQDLKAFETVFRTPIFDSVSCPAIPQMRSLNGRNHSYFCGSNFGFGLHEDAVSSAIDAAKMLGAEWSA